MDDKQYVQLDFASLNLGNLKTVTFNLELPSRGKYGSNISWKTNDNRFIEITGRVHRPRHGIGNRTVKLTAIIKHGQFLLTKLFNITILQMPLSVKISSVCLTSIKVKANKQFYLPAWLPVKTDENRLISLAVSWPKIDLKGHTFQKGQYEFKGNFREVDFPFKFCVNVTSEDSTEKLPQRKLWFEPLENISLKEGTIFYNLQQARLKFLQQSNPDDYLYNFRQAAGLPVVSGHPLIGWDAPDSLLRGHTTGHYLSALALCYAATHDSKILKKATYMISSLTEIQNNFSKQLKFHEGYLGAYSEKQFDELEAGATYPNIWAPYYTLHKILSGLIDIYHYCHNQPALSVACKIGDWVNERLSKLSYKKRNHMWETYIAGEFGGINESLAQLTEITQQTKYVQTAKLFNHDRLMTPLAASIDALDGMHANQHIPQVIGLLEIYKVTHELPYFKMADFFWQTVVQHHTYSFGGVGKSELFQGRDELGQRLGSDSAETCATYNMLKLTKKLFEFDPSAAKMAYYENATFNHIAASSAQDSSGGSTYFMPTGYGEQKQFDVDNTCCHGTGLENHFKYGEAIYAYDNRTVWVNLPISSTVEDSNHHIYIDLDADLKELSGLKITAFLPNQDCLKIRVPEWAKITGVSYEGKKLSQVKMVDGYIQVNLTEIKKFKLEIFWTPIAKLERLIDRPDSASMKFGPYSLAVITKLNNPVSVSQNNFLEFSRQCLKENSETATLKGLSIMPLCQVNHEKYQLYVHLEK
ncbi:beta-L-arabinofuranosidase domain-containing protein [Secundilactobacillus odoratitofui]|uniref:beta-L-arabinofuranosidase domain-containing protein n=1 Tax=Secundilactobacillus odoratitofui TaxID=480930 RepID=UPI00138F2880|nr:beta-L-arabinofuranosidase domain-containing protein [Secundilactobacillus odoratitofui]